MKPTRGIVDIDAWVGGLAEPDVGGGLVGETWRAVLVDQFVRLRTGDRFWYESYLTPELIVLVEGQTLATIIRRNTEFLLVLVFDVRKILERSLWAVTTRIARLQWD